MKRVFTAIALACVVVLSSCSTKFDDGDLWNNINNLEDRVGKLEEQCRQMNTNILSLQSIVVALQNQTSISKVEQNADGYTIHFSDGSAAVIKNGKDSGDAPIVGIRKDSDGNYYWTLNGEFIIVDGAKVKAQGADGKDGVDGTNGKDGHDGTDGKDGVVPQLKIDAGYWYITYDNGVTWTRLGKATGEDGKDGADGKDGHNGDGIKVTQDDKSVYFELPDGTVIVIQKNIVNEDTRIISFKDPKTKAICIKAWDSNGDGELSYGEASRVTSLSKYFRNSGIETFDEFQYFTDVVEIDNNTFYGCAETLTSIVLPESLEWFETYDSEGGVFKNFTKLQSIVIPNSVTWIGHRTFFGCTGLTDITIPDGVKTIGNAAFKNCTGFTSVVIPNSVTSLGSSVFSGCTGLTSVVISNSVTSLGGSVFSGCTGLTSVVIPNSVTSLDNYVFYGCTGLTSIIIPDGVTFISYSAFYNCASLKDIYCKPTTPPALDSDNVFDDIASGAKIYVPRASVDTYKSAGGWKKYYSKIYGYDFE